MSESTASLSSAQGSTPATRFWGFVLPLVGFLLFSILTIFLLRSLQQIPSEDEQRAQERLKILQAFKAEEADKIGSGYAWVDSNKKIVRIPIDRAMEVVLPELQNKVVGPAYPIGGAPGATVNPAASAPATSTTPVTGLPKTEKAK